MWVQKHHQRRQMLLTNSLLLLRPKYHFRQPNIYQPY
jgi:hypothetical protein